MPSEQELINQQITFTYDTKERDYIISRTNYEY